MFMHLLTSPTAHCFQFIKFSHFVEIAEVILLMKERDYEMIYDLFQTPRARLEHDTSTTWFQTSKLIQSKRTAVAENKTQN